MLSNSGKGFGGRGNKKDSSQIHASAKSVRRDLPCFTKFTSFMLQPLYYASRRHSTSYPRT